MNHSIVSFYRFIEYIFDSTEHSIVPITTIDTYLTMVRRLS
jgi:hypothetical protein